MARGYPDFFGYEVSPKYGTPVIETKASAAIASGVWGPVFNFTGKGRTYGGYVQFNGTDDDTYTSLLRVTIDGVVHTIFAPLALLDYGLTIHDSYPWILTRLGQCENLGFGDYRVVWQAIKDWTFGQSYVVEIRNNTALAGQVWGELIWSRMI